MRIARTKKYPKTALFYFLKRWVARKTCLQNLKPARHRAVKADLADNINAELLAVPVFSVQADVAFARVNQIVQ